MEKYISEVRSEENYSSETHLSLIVLILGITINLNFHYILGGIIVVIGTALLILELVIAVLQQKYKNDLPQKIKNQVIYSWITKLLLAFLIPLMIFVAYLILSQTHPMVHQTAVDQAI